MPKVEVKLWDVERVAKTPLTLEDLGKHLELLKAEVEEVRGDTVVYDASHDRPDLFSAEGLGRAIGLLKGARKPIKYVVEDSGTYLDVRNAPSYRPYAYFAIVENLDLDEESVRQLFQLQEKLHTSYCGDRELAAIGLYDLDKIKLPVKYVEVETARYRPLGYDSIMSLEEVLTKTEKGVKYAHLVRRGRYPLLVDSEGQVMGFPPILNPEDNKVTENTRRIVIDVTGTEPHLMMKILNLVTTSVSERSRNPVIKKVLIKGGSTYSVSPLLESAQIRVEKDSIKSLLGIDPLAKGDSKLLELMGYNVLHFDAKEIVVEVSPFRIDVLSYVDVIEDIAIAYGYNELGGGITPSPHFGSVNPLERFADYVREILLGLGLQEVMNFMLTDPDVLGLISEEDFVKLKNPKMKIYSAVRNSLTPTLLMSIRVNSTKRRSFGIFEVGDVVKLSGDARPTYVKMLAYGLAGDEYTLTDGLIVLKSLMTVIGVNYELRRSSRKSFIRGRSAEVVVKDEIVGVVGEACPEILTSLNIYVPATIAEINLSKLFTVLSS
ncbi:MAG: phenylalanine--tRNA ligase subunit beta [Zestosphaera sp.]